jgi:hypothetical protein
MFKIRAYDSFSVILMRAGILMATETSARVLAPRLPLPEIRADGATAQLID